MRRHELDVLSLVFGLFFVGAAAAWGLTGDRSVLARGWPLPTLLITVGTVGVLASISSAWRGQRQPARDIPAEDIPVVPDVTEEAGLSGDHGLPSHHS